MFLRTGISGILCQDVGVEDLTIGLVGMLTAVGRLGAECKLAEVLQNETILSSLLSIELKRFFI